MLADAAFPLGRHVDPGLAARVDRNVEIERDDKAREMRVLAALPGTPAELATATDLDWLVVIAALHTLCESRRARRLPGGRYERTGA